MLRDTPSAIDSLSPSEWDRLVRLARHTKLMGHLYHRIEDAGLAGRCPEPAMDMLIAGSRYASFLQANAGFLVRAVLRAIEPESFPLLLLKGAAYRAAGLPNAPGRILSDVDILVRREHLEGIERCLLAAGWEHQNLDSYDQRYYREWMHEIPPLRHPEQGIEVDIHHTLLPVTARLTPDPGMLWEASVPLADCRLRVLAPADMVLHCATHLFYDGEIKGGLRDLVDLHELFRHFGRENGFWDRLPARAEALQLARPLHYALRYCRQMLGTPIPHEVMDHAERHWAPTRPAQALMDLLVRRVLRPKLPGEEPDAAFSAWLLYLRSHWLRMPPLLLASHLSRKGWRRLRGTWGDADQ
jgi:hypothetical protein